MRVAVLGSGAIGLCTAITLLKNGRQVVIYTQENDNLNAENTVSIVACALWQPYKLYQNLDETKSEVLKHIWKISSWSLNGFFNLLKRFTNEEIGVYERSHFEYSYNSIIGSNNKPKAEYYYIELLHQFWKNNYGNLGVINEIKLQPQKAIYSEENHNLHFQYLHKYNTYIIDTPIYLKFLKNEFIRLGGEIQIKKISKFNIQNLKEKTIFNCTGNQGFKTIYSSGKNLLNHRKMIAKKGVLMLYPLKTDSAFKNTIVMDELTILCRRNFLTIGTGELKNDESVESLTKRLISQCKRLINNTEYDDFGLGEFIKNQEINLNDPCKILVGSRPSFTDGAGYLLNHVSYPSNEEHKINLYNNFGHGGSGITLCWGTANEICELYLQNVNSVLNTYNKERHHYSINKYSIELCHFDYKEIRKMTDFELNQKIEHEYSLLNQELVNLEINKIDCSVCVLIDNKGSNDSYSENRLLSCLKPYDVDFIAHEKGLVEYLDQLDSFLPPSIKNEFDKRQINHQALGCSQDIFLWYSIRFGLVLFDNDDDIIIPLSEKAMKNEKSFYGNSLITLLPIHLKTFEENADKYIKKTFGSEICSSIKRIYYDRKTS